MEQQFYRNATCVLVWPSHSGEVRCAQIRREHVVEADNADVFGYAGAPVGEPTEHPDGQQVVVGDGDCYSVPQCGV